MNDEEKTAEQPAVVLPPTKLSGTATNTSPSVADEESEE